jgi:hypothetical protein
MSAKRSALPRPRLRAEGSKKESGAFVLPRSLPPDRVTTVAVCGREMTTPERERYEALLVEALAALLVADYRRRELADDDDGS